jgi:hypothetical protein
MIPYAGPFWDKPTWITNHTHHTKSGTLVNNAGIVAITQSPAKEVTSMGAIINAVAPGPALSGLVKTTPPESLESFRELTRVYFWLLF